jgi:uncharacterized protein (TIGR03437 family)
MVIRSVVARTVLGLILASIAATAQTPVIFDNGIVNAASFEPKQAVAPGSLASIFGTGLATQQASAASIPVSTNLAGVSVTINGIGAPLSFVSSGLINFQVPYGVLPAGTNGSVNVVVSNSNGTSAPQPVVINQFGPGVFSVNGYALAVIITADPKDPRYGLLAAPAGTFPGLTTASAKAGDALIIYANGLGPVSPAGVTGDITPPGQFQQTTTNPTVLIGNVPAPLFGAGLAPQYVGVYQVNVQVPQVPAGKKVPLQIQMGGVTSSAAVTIGIQ